MYFEFTKEKIFPLAVLTSLILTGIAVFVLFDAFSTFTSGIDAYVSRSKSDAYYWLLYKYPRGVSAYAAASDTPPARSIPILLYHGESAATGNTPLSVFVEQMQAMKREGWQTITLEQFRDFMKNDKPLPDKSFLLTFDDGRRDTFYPADPVLKDLGFTGVMFVITGLSMPDGGGSPQSFYLDKHELQYMLDSGRWELQSHGKMDHLNYHVQSTTDLSQEAETVDGHFMSNKLWNDAANRFETDAEFSERVRNDLTLAKEDLEQQFQQPIFAYAYPFNDFGQDTVNFPGAALLVAQVVPKIYTFAFYQHWPANGDSFNYPNPEKYMIKRIEPRSDWTAKDLINVLNAGHAKDLPYQQDAKFGIEWVGIWGDVLKGDTLSLNANSETNGSAAFLNGTAWWKDYIFTADVHWVSGQSILLVARNTDDVDYLACSFSTQSVGIEKHHGLKQVVLASSPIGHQPGSTINVGISVKGSLVQCYVDGQSLISTNVADPKQGGIGVEVWDHSKDVSKAEFTNINVKPL